LKMNEDENIASYFLRVDEIVNNIKGLGDEIKEQVIVKKALRSLPMRFDSKISSLEERVDLATMTMDELHGILTAYEMRIEQDNPVMKEATFKASKKTKKKDKQNPKSDCSCSDDSEEDEEVANFVRRLKRGTDKYKGMLPLKFVLIVMVLVIFLINVPIRKRKVMKKMTLKKKKNPKG
jgi:uncharacterized coiled-coil protein SlyX